MKIYFAGAIRGGRDDVALYLELVELLRPYGTVLTEHVADEQLTSLGESMDDRAIHNRDLTWLKEADCLVAEVTTPGWASVSKLARQPNGACASCVSFDLTPVVRSPH